MGAARTTRYLSIAIFGFFSAACLSTSPTPLLPRSLCLSLCEHFIKIMHRSVATPPLPHAASLAAVSAFLLA